MKKRLITNYQLIQLIKLTKYIFTRGKSEEI